MKILKKNKYTLLSYLSKYFFALIIGCSLLISSISASAANPTFTVLSKNTTSAILIAHGLTPQKLYKFRVYGGTDGYYNFKVLTAGSNGDAQYNFSGMTPGHQYTADCGEYNAVTDQISSIGVSNLIFSTDLPPVIDVGVIPAVDGGNNITTGIDNPLGSGIDSIPGFIEEVLTTIIYIGVPIVTLAIIYAGFLFVTAQGNEEKLTAAKKTLMYTLIGAALLLGSLVIANAIKGTVDEIKKTS